jgi:hypothetical protein
MMKHIKLFFLLITLAIFWQGANAAIIHVPGDSSTIQGAVHGTENGDTILVAPGVYQENVDVYCKAILLASHYLFDNDTLTINSTIIDGGGGQALFLHGGDCFPENESLTIIGFTIRNSQYAGVYKELSPWYGQKAKSRICHNRFMGNYCGVSTLTWDECIIDHNIFVNNQIGLECYGGAAKPPLTITIVENNAFLFNTEIGASSVGASVPIFRNNIFSRNGWGIAVAYYSSLKAVGNVICNNSVGIYHELPDFESWLTIENNIIAANDTGIYLRDPLGNAQIRYNAVKSLFLNFIGCPADVGDTTWGTNFNGTPCDSFYNITRDPLFADTIDFELLCNSPCIDAGDSSAQVPESGGYRIDMGKNEFPYIIGDANNDYRIDVTDVVLVINYLFIHGPAPCPYHSSDTNGDGIINSSDIVCLINYLFCGSTFPCF